MQLVFQKKKKKKQDFYQSRSEITEKYVETKVHLTRFTRIFAIICLKAWNIRFLILYETLFYLKVNTML